MEQWADKSGKTVRRKVPIGGVVGSAIPGYRNARGTENEYKHTLIWATNFSTSFE